MAAYAYIDVENLNNSVRQCGYQSVDYHKLFNWLKTKKGVERVYLYAAIEAGDAATQAKYDSLKKLGYIVRLKELQHYPDQTKLYDIECACGQINQKKVTIRGKQKANCDSELTLDVINDGVRKKYSEIIVFSGDGDFARMYEYVNDQLKRRVSIYSPTKGIPGKRTSSKIKTLHNNGTVILNALEALLLHYAIK